ncbi:MAG: SusC/RagA family TonB-linked outer membrane protein [Gemmatimonadales bacterium]|nr:SusC/RagA family TonB-linked outer membrane protein [Gemmatimonadales bacterium]
MLHMLQRQHRFRMNCVNLIRGVAASVMLALVLCGAAQSQQVQVSGYVTTAAGDPIEGVTVAVLDGEARTTTDTDGRYEIVAPINGVLIFTLLGYRAQAIDVAGRTMLDVTMESAVAVLDEIIVTGYTEQRRADITGAVSSIDTESLERETSTSVLKRLEGKVAGVTVDASGSPGSRSTVRIRGFSSFQNNDPLYIIDGTPVEGSYMNWLNPNDIESMQVLKDASAASIYGSRATNGVIIIETRKQGPTGAPRFTIDTRFGMATPVRGYDDILITDALEYAEIIRRGYENAGLTPPTNIYGDGMATGGAATIPQYIWPNRDWDGDGDLDQTTQADVDTIPYVYGDPGFQDGMIMPGSRGTNWWDEVFGRGYVADINLSLAGSGESHGYNVSFNYLNQEGTAVYNLFQRYSGRANTQFSVGRFRVGENLAVAYERSYGGHDDGDIGEGSILGKNILMQPVVPVHDASGENYAGGKAVGLGNQTNPVYSAWADKDDIGQNLRVFGNVFAGVDVTPDLQFTSRFGVNLNEWSSAWFNPIEPMHSEPTFTNGIGESYNLFREWTWSNTLQYSTEFGGRHSVNLLLGQEASKSNSRWNSSSIANLISTSPDARYIQDALGDAASKNVSSGGGKAALASLFGKLDYNFAERYHLSFTLRRDGSSRLGPETRWGTFPAFSVGWRLSQEPFLQQSRFFTNIMLRFGWGVTGNQAIPSGRVVSQFGGGRGDTFYDITGSGNSIVPGYRQTSLGNPNLKWEENKSMNVGLDLEFFGGAASFILDAYQRETENLLFDPQTPATAGIAAPPIINVGKMRNRGFDFSIGYTGSVGAGSWRVSFNGSHYTNEILYIDGVQEEFFGTASGARYGFTTINRIGYPIGSFYGLVADGFFETQAAADDYSYIDPDNPALGCPVACQDGAAPGRIRFRDLDGDGQVTADDRTIIGGPHPDFTAGLDLALEIGRWDFAATVYGTFGNDIWDIQKQFYVFQNFSTNVLRDLLDYSAEVDANGNVTNLDVAKYPRLDKNDTFSGQQVSSYYVEDGSYVRLRNLQVGYRLPESFIPGTRVYVQAENLFTITGYPGLDPALPALARGGAAGDVRDQYRGLDRGAYPSNKTLSVGISATF